MSEHAEVARRAGIDKVVLCRDGELIRLAPGAPGKIDEVPAGRLYRDGSLIVSADERTVADRRRLGFAGMVSVALAVSERGDLFCDPQVRLIGIPEIDRLGHRIEEIAYDAALKAFESMPRGLRREPEAVADAIRGAVRAALGA